MLFRLKKVGNAVERNRIRRRLREVVRLSPPSHMRPGHDYVLIGRRAALSAPLERIEQEFDRALRRVHTAPPDTDGARRAGTPHRGKAQQSPQ